ncbi:hypothetical protein COLO4_06809 [Corchorus olitorius]|uniref:Uncharacterized protein n=1 Tax=Corchorus olitorius TaxID=93759 RepID=A0A1R3KLW6_9ROSI|nr:hypothetical protein COLO4_06809 [Corchorus olitorius]
MGGEFLVVVSEGRFVGKRIKIRREWLFNHQSKTVLSSFEVISPLWTLVAWLGNKYIRKRQRGKEESSWKKKACKQDP